MAETNTPTTITIGDTIVVKDLADKLGVKISQVMGELIKKGVMATLTETIDFATAVAAAEALGFKLEKAASTSKITKNKSDDTGADSRPPIIAVMGHVDHGKTSLLDAIRKTDVVAGEAGGITQHLSAYQITYKQRPITFIDTPGHEAFAVLREHGAHLTDVAIIVVAADDGVKPQTVEAIKFAQKAGVKMVIAITKIDKPDTDINRVKTELAAQNLNPEEWGGDTVVVEVSAKAGTNLDKLLDLVLLVADIEELKARNDGPAEGMVIESHMATGQGTVATLLVQHGQLKVGDFITAGSTYAKVRRLESTDGKQIAVAGPSYPAVAAGWKALPQLGDRFEVVADEKTAKTATANKKSPARSVKSIVKATSDGDTKLKKLPLVIKSDVQGSLDSILQSFNEIKDDEVAIDIVATGVGDITESDIYLAESSGAQIIGFNVNLSVMIKQLAERAGVKVGMYKVIYELLDDVKVSLSGLLEPEVKEVTVGELDVQGVFMISQKSLICGGQVAKGVIKPELFVRWLKDEPIEIGKVINVQKEQQDAKDVKQGEMCGLSIETKHKANVKVGDRLEFFTRETSTRTLA